MKRHSLLSIVALALLTPISTTFAVTFAYGVDSVGNLFSFDLNDGAIPLPTTNIGNTGANIRAIDFRPLAPGETNPVLYGLGIDPAGGNAQLYTIDTVTGAATPVGSSFPSTVSGSYDLNTGTIGFDFNPTTLQADTSMRIRVVSSSTANLRLNSLTGQIAAVDVPLAFGGGVGGTPNVDAAAYINNIARSGGSTTLFSIDSGEDSLNTHVPPNAGVVNILGNTGVTVNLQPGVGFDIHTDPNDDDGSIAGDRGFAVLTRPETQDGKYLVYEVDLATGTIFNGRLVGPDGNADFSGGFALLPTPIPEPTVGLLLLGMLPILGRRRRD